MSNNVRFMDIDANRQIGKALRGLRLSQSLTQSEIAKRLGKPQSYVSKVEMGERSLHTSELFSYSDALGIPVEQVVQIMRDSVRLHNLK